METINSVTQTASKYIFGDKPEQTQAGETQAEHTQAEHTQAEQTRAEPTSAEPVSGKSGKGTIDEPFDAGNKNESSEPSLNKLPEQQGLPDPQKEVNTAQKTESPELNHQSTHKSVDEKGSVDGAVASENPKEGESKDKGADPLAKRDPNDHSGEPMHVHSAEEKKSEGEGGEKTEEQKKKDLEEKGTGEKWVKSSGLAADGGDFDATKPGAGREADRLLEEKGVHKSDSGEGGPSTHDSKDDSKKPSKMEKIKEKLHIGGSKHA